MRGKINSRRPCTGEPNKFVVYCLSRWTMFFCAEYRLEKHILNEIGRFGRVTVNKLIGAITKVRNGGFNINTDHD